MSFPRSPKELAGFEGSTLVLRECSWSVWFQFGSGSAPLAPKAPMGGGGEVPGLPLPVSAPEVCNSMQPLLKSTATGLDR